MKTQKIEKKPAKRGRKAAVFDLKKVEKYAAMGLTKIDIGRCLGYEHSTFFKLKANNARIEEAIQRGRSRFKIITSAALVKQMQNGNVTAAIWLEKTRCGVKESQGDPQTEAAPMKIIYEDQ